MLKILGCVPSQSIHNLREAGCKNIIIRMHRYRDNQDDLPLFIEFAKKHDVIIDHYCAYFNTFEYFKSYAEGTLNTDVLNKAKQELYLYDPKIVQEIRPIDYMCTQFDILTLSHTGKMSLCYTTPLDSYEYEMLDFDKHPKITPVEIYKIRENNALCQNCRKLCLDYVMVEGITCKIADIPIHYNKIQYCF